MEMSLDVVPGGIEQRCVLYSKTGALFEPSVTAATCLITSCDRSPGVGCVHETVNIIHVLPGDLNAEAAAAVGYEQEMMIRYSPNAHVQFSPMLIRRRTRISCFLKSFDASS